MADSTGLGFWGTLWQGLEGSTGKASEAPGVRTGTDVAYLGFWGTVWRDREAGFDGKTPSEPPAVSLVLYEGFRRNVGKMMR